MSITQVLFKLNERIDDLTDEVFYIDGCLTRRSRATRALDQEIDLFRVHVEVATQVEALLWDACAPGMYGTDRYYELLNLADEVADKAGLDAMQLMGFASCWPKERNWERPNRQGR